MALTAATALNNRPASIALGIAGFLFLAGYLLLVQDFSFSPLGSLAYIGLSFGISYAMAALKLADRFPALDSYCFFPRSRQAAVPLSDDEWVAKQAAYLASVFGRYRIIVTPAEDGLICVPLVMAGISSVTATLGGVAFGLLHLPRYTHLECIGKTVIYGLACFFILPYGLLTVVAGHFLNDLVGLVLLKAIRKALARTEF